MQTVSIDPPENLLFPDIDAIQKRSTFWKIFSDARPRSHVNKNRQLPVVIQSADIVFIELIAKISVLIDSNVRRQLVWKNFDCFVQILFEFLARMMRNVLGMPNRISRDFLFEV